MCSGLRFYFKCLNCLKLYQMAGVHVQFAFYEFVIMIHKIPLFSIKLAIFSFPPRIYSTCGFPQLSPNLEKLTVQPSSGASCRLGLVLLEKKKMFMWSLRRFQEGFYKVTSLYKSFQSVPFKLPASSAPWWPVEKQGFILQTFTERLPSTKPMLG